MLSVYDLLVFSKQPTDHIHNKKNRHFVTLGVNPLLDITDWETYSSEKYTSNNYIRTLPENRCNGQGIGVLFH